MNPPAELVKVLQFISGLSIGSSILPAYVTTSVLLEGFTGDTIPSMYVALNIFVKVSPVTLVIGVGLAILLWKKFDEVDFVLIGGILGLFSFVTIMVLTMMGSLTGSL